MGAIAIDFTQERYVYGIKTQDAKLFSEMRNAYFGAVYKAVFRVVNDRDIAEEVVQDTFLKVWRNGPGYDPSKGRLYSWLMQIGRNTALDAIRSARYKAKKRNISAETSLIYEHAYQADSHLFDMAKHVAALPEKYRFLVQRFYFEGYQQDEISIELGIPIGTVKTRLRQALKLLREVYVD